MNASCQAVLERLVEGVTGRLPPSERDAIVAHLAVCESCRIEAAEIESTADHLRDAPMAPPPGFWTEFTQGLQRRIEAERTPPLIRLRRWLVAPWHAMGTAAAALAMVLVISLAMHRAPAPQPPDPVAATARQLVTDTMTSTLPSLGQVLDTWRAGLAASGDPTTDRPNP